MDISFSVLDPIFKQARQRQIHRLARVFTHWKLPDAVCGRYHERYARRQTQLSPREYREMCDSFWRDVTGEVSIHPALNDLDLATLFGEIMRGQRLADGRLVFLFQPRQTQATD
jgi:hypothetical protein